MWSHANSMAATCSKPGPCEFEKWKYNPLCDADKESLSDMLNEELNIDFDDIMNLEFDGETVSEESSNEKLGSECDSETVAQVLLGDSRDNG
jgi:hypothetical protein